MMELFRLANNQKNEVKSGTRLNLVRGSTSRNSGGQTLIEVMAALTVTVLILVALLAATTVAVRNSQSAQNQALSTKYAQEGMEILRERRDNNSAVFFGSQPCFGITPTPTSPPGFTRTFMCENAITPPPTPPYTKIKATVTVKWTDSKGEHKSEQVSYFTKWQ